MNWNEYTQLAIRTAKPMADALQHDHARMGIVTEVGELMDIFKRYNVYDKPIDIANFREEIGDLCWYIALECHTCRFAPDLLPLVGLNACPNLELMYRLVRFSGHLTTHPTSQTLVEAMLSTIRQLCANHEVDFELCLRLNIAKLAKRFGDKFSNEAALVRDLLAEREALEV